MPAVLVTEANVTQNLLFATLVVAVAIASTRYAYPRRDGQAELAWVVSSNTEMVYVSLLRTAT